METEKKLYFCLENLRKKTNFRPEIALILGSGLGDYGDTLKIETIVNYNEIDGFPVSTVSGHKGRFLFGFVKEVPVVVMQGRVHYYEGYSMADVVLPVRLMGLMGAKALFLTNASGGVNFSFAPGDLMLITDQISSFVPSPLTGPNLDSLGPRFPDMSRIYDKTLCHCIEQAALQEQVPLQKGVYLQFTGPCFESPAEIRMARLLGADAVGMSTACEALAARHMGLKVCGVSCITNLACGMTDAPLSHEEVQETADRIAGQFTRLLNASIVKIAKEVP
ncbi:purine-nucleoside phosphorylase [bacterium 1XD42-1]|nr:purine-nucleoside phosphorylase [bacterium 1XD42-8]RKJ65809.1 purine-nucleoside phosphorylase [bacterium 1XD42-1]